MRVVIRRVSVLVLMLMGVGGPALAQESPDAVPPMPPESVPEPSSVPQSEVGTNAWNMGVTQQMRDEATKIAGHGAQLIKGKHYVEALNAYRQALDVWDDPNLHVQIAECQQALGRTVLAFEEMEKALAFGDAPLRDPEGAHDYKTFLRNQLSEISISTQEVDARVSVDGNEIFTGPATKTIMVEPGRHQILAEKAGMTTVVEDVIAVAAEDVDAVAISMMPLPENIVMKRRWKVWKPWAVAGTGAVLTLIGVPLYQEAAAQKTKYENFLIKECTTPCGEGNPLSAEAKSARDNVGIYDKFAISLWIVGGTATAAGLVGAFLNRPQAVKGEEALPTTSRLDVRNLTIAPTIIGGKTGLTTSYSFEF